uniref:beta-1,4-galactosyltransferase 1-like isoform X2 n=1 Tax=Oncorhynchus gorbuscha TaxID=8017 RepID=UPI001EAF4CE6|nr:beta-1,4-galactosyltransferase 1-like isoform X2 [Oncorhynchus gorbuscha]
MTVSPSKRLLSSSPSAFVTSTSSSGSTTSIPSFSANSWTMASTSSISTACLQPITSQLKYGWVLPMLGGFLLFLLSSFEDGDNTFNRAKLMNIGYAEALKEYDYDCFVFSDVDLIPMDDRNTYKCFRQPRHLSVSMDKFGFKLPYNQYFGGVSALSKEQFLEINGFPNNYWGWGGEDDDIFNRVSSRGMSISRPDSEVGKCRMIRHERDKQNDPNPQRFDRIQRTRLTMNTDGINSLKYEVVKVEKDPLFTKITVDVGKP